KAKARACWAAAPIEGVFVRWPHRDESRETIEPISGLRELSVTSRFFVDSDVDRLADLPLLTTLRALNIHSCNLGVQRFRRLVASPHLGNLTALRAPSTSIGNGGIGALFDAVSLTSLEELDLSETDSYGRYGEDPIINSTGMELLARWPGLTRLRSLALS